MLVLEESSGISGSWRRGQFWSQSLGTVVPKSWGTILRAIRGPILRDKYPQILGDNPGGGICPQACHPDKVQLFCAGIGSAPWPCVTEQSPADPRLGDKGHGGLLQGSGTPLGTPAPRSLPTRGIARGFRVFSASLAGRGVQRMLGVTQLWGCALRGVQGFWGAPASSALCGVR